MRERQTAGSNEGLSSKYAEPQRSQPKAFQSTDYITRNSAATSYCSVMPDLMQPACACMRVEMRKCLLLMQQSEKRRLGKCCC